jgi:hypothetical protein
MEADRADRAGRGAKSLAAEPLRGRQSAKLRAISVTLIEESRDAVGEKDAIRDEACFHSLIGRIALGVLDPRRRSLEQSSPP